MCDVGGELTNDPKERHTFTQHHGAIMGIIDFSSGFFLNSMDVDDFMMMIMSLFFFSLLVLDGFGPAN